MIRPFARSGSRADHSAYQRCRTTSPGGLILPAGARVGKGRSYGHAIATLRPTMAWTSRGGAWGRSVNQRNLSSYPNLCTGGAMSHVDRSWATNQTVALASGRAGRAWVESWSLITVQLLPQSSCPILRVFAVLRSKVQPQSRRNQRAARCWADSGRGCGDRPDWPSCGDRTGGGRCQRR